MEEQIIDFSNLNSNLNARYYYDMYTNLIDSSIVKTSKPFNFKLLSRNELSASGKLEIPPIDFNKKIFAKSLGQIFMTEFANKKFNLLELDINDDIYKQIKKARYNENTIDHNIYLFTFSLFISNAYMFNVITIDREHYFYKYLQEDIFKILLTLSDANNYAFMSSKIYKYEVKSDGAIIVFYIPLTMNLLPYINYHLQNFGKIDAPTYNLKIKRKKIKESVEDEEEKKEKKKSKKVVAV